MGAEQWDAALATAQRLIAVDAGRIEGPLFASYVASEKAKDDAAWASQAVQYAAQAQAIDPLDPRPSIAYFYSYLASRQEVPENAVIAMENSLESAGTDPTYRVLLSRQLLFENRLPAARSVLQPIAFRGHNQGDPFEGEDAEDADKPTLDKIMAFIEQDNRDAALAMIDDLIDGDDEEA
jgi:hypothetical protein